MLGLAVTRASVETSVIARHSIWLLAAAVSAVPVLALAQSAPLRAPLIAKATAAVEADAARLVGIYKDLHQNPELGFMEVRTAAIVAKELAALGFDVKTGIGKTGVVAVLKNGPGPVVMYRADMDANAVEEATGLPYASKVRAKLPDGTEAPVAHMCGHDAHVTWMLVVQYQAIVSRTIEPQQTAVLTVGSIQAGIDNNVIPSTALVKANLRWYEPKVREQLIAGIRSVSNGIARTYGMPEDQMPVITMKGGSTPLVNDDALAKRLAVPLRGLLGDQSVVTEFPPATGSEDAHLLVGPHADVPFTYLIVGIADPAVFAAAQKEGKLVPYSSHNPNFLVDVTAIPLGAKVATVAMLELLKTRTPK